ncbi:NACHT domain-containing protein [Streptomyces sp. WMMC500]|uniref:NACHT domain-containing protein n=1 Tax=Streptomyces sp. WMMC500 TaxID=3015154 RepID=UPI00248CD22F|nr:NACHT domain-containing protein [Streptomyces sp. WMMC500]WBB64025.1 NACHT domain-containing protein [Streptomyces sp. WMMC500]
MLAETAALRLGTIVANAAAKLWLGGRQRAQERQLPMAELIRVRVPGVRLQREVRQQFEQITNAVYDRLDPYLTHAFERLEPGGRQAVIDAVADTFARADLSDDALLVADARPAELVRRITASVPPPVGLGETESRLYETLFAECVAYYVRIVRSLPVFEERAAAELLARTSTLGAEVARILERLPDRSLFAPDGSDLDTDFRRTYLELVSRELDEVELFRGTSDQATPHRIRLSVAYVSLRTTGDDAEIRRAARHGLLQLRPDMSNWEEGGPETSGMRVEAALRGASRVLLRGEAGSGKTTLLRWLAITAARGGFTDELAAWNGLTPFFVKLRDYSGRKPPNPEAMLDGVAGPITGVMPKGWVERQLDAGKALLLIDGVDELLHRERQAVRDWLRRLLGQYEDVRVVVTSRPAAAGADWLRREDFTALHLDRMTPPDLAAFVRQWHQAVRELGGELPCAVDDLPQYEQSLLTSLKDRAHLQSLASTPLLAAMLCAMHLNRGRQLPRDRMELYRNALHTLVHDRDADRNVPSAAESKLSLGDKLVILRDLAWRLSDNNRSEIDVERAAGYVTAKLKGMRHLDVVDGAQVLGHLRQRSGILRTPAEDRIDFVHRTFQEYLAAEEAAEEDRIGNLVERAHLDLWRETIIMTAGHANAKQREELLDGILDRAEEEPRYARTLRLLAVACQETLPSVPDGLAGRLDEAVTTLLPARRKTDPPALAAVGPTLLRWLPTSLEELTEKAAAQTVRTVALIGGEKALDMLEGFVGDDRRGVVRELVRAWDYFGADTYADRVLCRLPLAGRMVDISHSGQLRAASRLRGLTGINVRQPVRGLDFVADLPPLRILQALSLGDGADLSVLRDHPDLELLSLHGSRSVRGGSVLPELTRLQHLVLPFSGDLDLSALRRCPDLRNLALREVADKDLGSVTALSGLDYILLIGNGRSTIRGFDELRGLTGLTDLRLSAVDGDAWLRGVKSLPPSLTDLALVSSVVSPDRETFARFSRLDVVLDHCRTPDGMPVTASDIPGVRVLTD